MDNHEAHEALRRLEDAIEEYGSAERMAGALGGAGGTAQRAQQAKKRTTNIAREIIYEETKTHA